MTKLKASGKSCSICGHRITLSPEDGEYIWCKECMTVRTKFEYDGAQYNTNYSRTYIEYAKGPYNTQLNLFRLGLISRWLKKDAKILDVGCCVGEFIRFAEKHYYCSGFEPNLVAAKEATNRTHSIVTTSLNGSCIFDCITLFDVIEHVQDPKDFLKHLRSILRQDGILAITTPNVSAVTNHSTRKCADDAALRVWKHYKPKEHLFLYNPASLFALLYELDFEVVHQGTEESDIRPGNPNRDLMTCVAKRS